MLLFPNIYESGVFAVRRSTRSGVYSAKGSANDFFRLLITFAKALDPDQTRHLSYPIWIQLVWHSDGTFVFP